MNTENAGTQPTEQTTSFPHEGTSEQRRQWLQDSFKNGMRGAQRISLRGANLRDLHLYGLDFTGADLTQADVTNCAFYSCNLANALGLLQTRADKQNPGFISGDCKVATADGVALHADCADESSTLVWFPSSMSDADRRDTRLRIGQVFLDDKTRGQRYERKLILHESGYISAERCTFKDCRFQTDHTIGNGTDARFENCCGVPSMSWHSDPHSKHSHGAKGVTAASTSFRINTPTVFVEGEFNNCTFSASESITFHKCKLVDCKFDPSETASILLTQCTISGTTSTTAPGRLIVDTATHATFHAPDVLATLIEPGGALTHRKLCSLRFISMDLRQVDFRGADLEQSDFVGCTLDGARFDHSDTKLNGARFRNRTSLTHASFDHANANGSTFVAPDLRSASFVGTSLVRAFFEGNCDARGANFATANVYDMRVADAIITIDASTQLGNLEKRAAPSHPNRRSFAVQWTQQPPPPRPAIHSRPLQSTSIAPAVAHVPSTAPPEPACERTPPLLFPSEVVRALIAAMLTRPMVLLAGISGSGKTQLARRIGAAYAAGHFRGARAVNEVLTNLRQAGVLSAVGGAPATHGSEPSLNSELLTARQLHVHAVDETALVARCTYAFTSVRSDWTDATHLWGYLLPTTSPPQFHATETLRVFLAGRNDTAPTPRFVLLDEMNLARPEHYGSDLLSAMEVIRDASEERGVLQPIELHRAGEVVDADPSRAEQKIPARAAWPKGLVVVGTVNVDETTFSFAPKVLDRAAILEFTQVDLLQAFKTMEERSSPKRAYATAYEQPTVKAWFTSVQDALGPHNLHLAYRAAKECMDVLFVQLGDTPKAWDAAALMPQLDLLLMSKVLPRVRGPRETVEPILKDLLAIAQGGTIKVDTRRDVASALKGSAPTMDMPARRKILQMLLRAHDIGFAGFFG